MPQCFHDMRFWSQLASHKSRCEPADNCLTALQEFLTFFCVGGMVSLKYKWSSHWHWTCVWDQRWLAKINVMWSGTWFQGKKSAFLPRAVRGWCPSLSKMSFPQHTECSLSFFIVLKVSGTAGFNIIIIQLLDFTDLPIKTCLHQVLHRYFIGATNLADVL